jgi:molybdate transport system substrate-binding protein
VSGFGFAGDAPENCGMSRKQSRIEMSRLAVAGLFIFFVAAAAVFPVAAHGQQGGSITVSAAISLKDALDEIAPMYEKRVPGAKIALNFGGSGTLEHQIEQGAPADVFFSAAEKQMNAMDVQGLLLKGARRDIVLNTLVLIVPHDSNVVQKMEDLERPEVKAIALGEPNTVPAGLYAQQTLEHLGMLEAVRKKMVYAKDVRAVLTFVASGNADAGFVYGTDARTSAMVRVVATAPTDSHDEIVYPAAVLKRTKNPELAKAFLDFLASDDARGVFVKYGFSAAEKQADKN